MKTMKIDKKIKDKNLQYNIITSVSLSGKMEKYEYLTGKERSSGPS